MAANGLARTAAKPLRSSLTPVFIHPGFCSKKKASAAVRGQSLSGHVSYQWCDGQVGFEAVLSPVAADGADNHSSSSFFQFVRGEGSVGHARGNSSMKWYEDKIIKDFCKSPNDLPDYSF